MFPFPEFKEIESHLESIKQERSNGMNSLAPLTTSRQREKKDNLENSHRSPDKVTGYTGLKGQSEDMVSCPTFGASGSQHIARLVKANSFSY